MFIVLYQIGNVGLTWAEQRTHMAYWCIVSAPLLAGNDIVHATNETLQILTAAEYAPFYLSAPFVQWGKVRICVLYRHYAVPA